MLTPDEAVKYWNQYHLYHTQEDIILALSEVPKEAKTSSDALTRLLGREYAHSVGTSVKNLMKNNPELIFNNSSHGGRFDWKLTAEGYEVAEIIKRKRND